MIVLSIPREALTWGIAGIATAGVVGRPFNWPEAIWAALGAALLVSLGLLPAAHAWAGVVKGADVYMFLVGMMLLSEVARREGLFDWVAAHAIIHAKKSPARLFLLVYLVGVFVTAFLSNDATAVVLTPAVCAATKTAKIDRPLPYLLICAFIANAASFVLPISNPANLVVYGGGRMPPLPDWLATFGPPSLVSILATYAALRLWVARDIGALALAAAVGAPPLARCGGIAALGICFAAAGLIGASALGRDLGAPTLAAGVLTAALVLAIKREGPVPLLRDISWSVLPLVAGLFVFVEALDDTGVTGVIAGVLRRADEAPHLAAAVAGGAVALVSNLANNLPAGLVAASAIHQAATPPQMSAAMLIGVDLGPNLSVTGSLATILWLTALRREGQQIGALAFLKIGTVVMTPALILSLATLIATASYF
jgi:arsenical pump membrane protein